MGFFVWKERIGKASRPLYISSSFLSPPPRKDPLVWCFYGSAIFCFVKDEHFCNLLFRLLQKKYYQVIHELSPSSEVLCRHMFSLKTSYKLLQLLPWLRRVSSLLSVPSVSIERVQDGNEMQSTANSQFPCANIPLQT